ARRSISVTRAFCPQGKLRPVSTQLSSFEAAAYARMLDEALLRHRRNTGDRIPVRLPKVNSYMNLAATLRQWDYFTAEAVLLRDAGPTVWLASVAQLKDEPFPPRGVLAAADGTWVLEQDGRVTRLY
ncbi:MAG: hypothetical protein ACRDPJ_02290, partial [Nocardioidaceae bacterium]